MQTDHDKKCSAGFSINVHGGNVQINPDVQNSTITQNNYISNISVDEMLSLIKAVRKATPANLSAEDAEIVFDSLSVIETETISHTPKNSFLINAMNALKTIKGTAEFGAALATLIQFVQIALK